MSDVTTDLSDIINGDLREGPEDIDDNPTLPVEDEAPAPEAEAAPAETGETEATPAKADDVDDGEAEDAHPVPRKALIEERKKRQEYERKLAELEGRLSAYTEQANQQPKANEPNPDDEFYSDPVKFVETKLQQAQQQQRIELSEELMRGLHDDYDDVVNEFSAAAKANPALVSQALAASNPARFAYDYAKNAKLMAEAGDLDSMREKMRAEIREEFEAEQRKKAAATAAAQASTSSAGARSAGAKSPEVIPQDLGEILPGVGF